MLPKGDSMRGKAVRSEGVHSGRNSGIHPLQDYTWYFLLGAPSGNNQPISCLLSAHVHWALYEFMLAYCSLHESAFLKEGPLSLVYPMEAESNDSGVN